ncbi:MAG: peptide chain release factor 1 [Chloroflexaceae bacterium]|nr:peptide chain release factor 1 [Chloroflexaceae bacterium]
MFDKLASVAARYDELTNLMAQPDIINNLELLQNYAREQREIEDVAAAFREYRHILEQVEETQAMLSDGLDADMRGLAQEELEELRTQRTALEESLKLLLLPRDRNDARDVVIEVRQGEGGDEAALFAADLFRMYYRYAETQGWKVEVISSSENEIGGYKEVIFEVRGEGAYSQLKYEGGVHRVQRVPETEARGRIHTSTATVAVLPKIEATEVELRDDDYRLDVFRAQGHGGQGVNTTDSAVRIVYRPGTPEEIVVTCQDGRSQLKNKEQALSVLRSRLYAREQQRRQRELGETRLAQVGTGERAEKIRTYNFAQDRVTDHRIGQNFSNLPGLLAGDMRRMVDALTMYDNAERMKAAGIN